MKKIVIMLVSLLILASLACSTGSVFATPTLQPTYTPQPTYTLQPTYTKVPTSTPIPTETPVPDVAGINVPLIIDDMFLMVRDVVRTDKFEIPYVDQNGVDQIATLSADDPRDRVLIIEFTATGLIENVAAWHNLPAAQFAHVLDNKDRRSDLWVSVYNDQEQFVQIMFVVDALSTGYVLYLPDGQEIDLTPFLP